LSFENKKLFFYDHFPLETGHTTNSVNKPKIFMDIEILLEKFCDYLTSIRGDR